MKRLLLSAALLAGWITRTTRGVKRALLWSLLANGSIVALGFLSRAVFGWP